MSPRLRSPSLFWTFAGAFLVVLVVGALLQAVLIVTVVDPLRRSAIRDRIEIVGRDAVARLERLPGTAGERDIIELLNALEQEIPGGRVALAYRMEGRRVIPSRELPPGLMRELNAQLVPPAEMARPAATRAEPRDVRGTPDGPPPHDRRGARQGGPRGEWQGGPPPGGPRGEWRGGPPPGGPRGEWQGGPPPGGPRDEWRDGPPEGVRGERPDGPPRDARVPTRGARDSVPVAATPVDPLGAENPRRARPRVTFAFRDSVYVGGRPGEIALFELPGSPSLQNPFGGTGLLVWFPLALVLAGGAGLTLFRGQVRRLRALEGLATRVAAGDLDARVGDASPDELGRLGRQLDRMTEAMAADRRQLEAVDAQRRKLLANISHELATPLTSIRGFAETLLDPGVSVSPEERQDYIRRVLGEAERLDLLTRDLLDLARLESGSMPLAISSLDWAELCRNTVERFAPRFAAARLTLEWCGPVTRAPIHADGRRLEQVLDNLIANALRYVPAGGRVEVMLDRAPEGGFVMAVQDDGPGIATADLPHLFDRFYRADAVRAVPGSGLGLSIVREIVQRHGGSVRALHRLPHGARFEVRMPEQPPRAAMGSGGTTA